MSAFTSPGTVWPFFPDGTSLRELGGFVVEAPRLGGPWDWWPMLIFVALAGLCILCTPEWRLVEVRINRLLGKIFGFGP